MRVKRWYQGSVCVSVALNMLGQEPTKASLFCFPTLSKSSKAAVKANLSRDTKHMINSDMSENVIE